MLNHSEAAKLPRSPSLQPAELAAQLLRAMDEVGATDPSLEPWYNYRNVAVRESFARAARLDTRWLEELRQKLQPGVTRAAVLREEAGPRGDAARGFLDLLQSLGLALEGLRPKVLEKRLQDPRDIRHRVLRVLEKEKGEFLGRREVQERLSMPDRPSAERVYQILEELFQVGAVHRQMLRGENGRMSWHYREAVESPVRLTTVQEPAWKQLFDVFCNVLDSNASLMERWTSLLLLGSTATAQKTASHVRDLALALWTYCDQHVRAPNGDPRWVPLHNRLNIRVKEQDINRMQDGVAI